MKIIVQEEWYEAIVKLLSPKEKEDLGGKYRYTTGKGKIKISIEKWSEESCLNLFQFLGEKASTGDRSAKLSQSIVKTWMEIKSNPDGQTVNKLEHVASAMTEFIGVSDHRYIFGQEKDGNFVPWFVKNIRFHDATEHGPAYVEVELNGINTGHEGRRNRGENGTEGTTFRISHEDYRRRTMSQILEHKGYYIETPARMASYEKEVQTYLAHCDEDGFQMAVIGKCKLIKGWSDTAYRPVGAEGRPARMVMDPPGGDRGSDAVHAPFWDANEEKVWPLPIHPVYEMFDLDEHSDYRVHVNNAEPYVYNDTVDEKLILPEDVKDFLTILIEHSKNKFQDIIGGKEGGTIVLIEGVPGVGKTLSAEVYSEKMHRPLYKVQSSQLGIDVGTVEKNLKEVLQRSERWGAILLIDEADVYIRERGSNIQQNAIVGVFLRVLEYYRGVLFLTTNLGNTVDDAIVSRTTARFLYEMPSKEDQFKLWQMMSDYNKVGLTLTEISEIISSMPNLSGRDIKNLIKLSMVMAVNKGTRVTPQMVKFVSRFKQSGKVK